MNLQLNGKVALVTASTAGIGYSIAERLLQEGATVIVNGRTRARVDGAVETLQTKYPSGQVRGIASDLTSETGKVALFSQLESVDILINNLGVYESKMLSDLREEDWTRMFEINVLSGAVLSQYYLKTMLQKNWGRIVFIASETGVNIPVDMIHYGVSKAAQIALSRGIAETTKGTAVTVNSVLPGPTLSEGVNTYIEAAIGNTTGDKEALKKQFIQELRPTSLLQRFSTPDEVANLVAYLSSPLSSATNGAAIRVEGGLLRNAG